MEYTSSSYCIRDVDIAKASPKDQKSFLGDLAKRRKKDRHEYQKKKSKSDRSDSDKNSMTEGEEFDVATLNSENFSSETVIPMDSLREPQDEPSAVRAKPVVKGETSDIPMLYVSQLETTASSSRPGNQSRPPRRNSRVSYGD